MLLSASETFPGPLAVASARSEVLTARPGSLGPCRLHCGPLSLAVVSETDVCAALPPPRSRPRVLCGFLKEQTRFLVLVSRVCLRKPTHRALLRSGSECPSVVTLLSVPGSIEPGLSLSGSRAPRCLLLRSGPSSLRARGSCQSMHSGSSGQTVPGHSNPHTPVRCLEGAESLV